MEKLVTRVSLSSKTLFSELTTRLKGKPDITQRVMAHIREVSGHATLPAYINNGATEQEKVEVLATCLRAILSNNFSELKGDVPKGQAPAGDPPDESTRVPATKVNSFKVGCKDNKDCKTWTYNNLRFFTADEAKEYGSDLFSRWIGLAAYEVHESEEEAVHHFAGGKVIYPEEKKPVPAPEPPPEVKEQTTETVNTPPPTPVPQPLVSVVDPKLIAITEALRALVQPAAVQQPAGIDEAKVREIVRQVLAEELQKAVAIQLHAEVKAAKFELVTAIQGYQETNWKRLSKAIAEVV